MIKISISGDSSSVLKDEIHTKIILALGPFTEQYPEEQIQLAVRKTREKNKVKEVA
jgi:hypothetical protein